ncbi:hypothetical protein BDZ89DRAFT_460927 [Hymenopellis radicata]|nr:hypothetical protein BDZ89DRAFT_460927 [Hymenopellis radicata]
MVLLRRSLRVPLSIVRHVRLLTTGDPNTTPPTVPTQETALSVNGVKTRKNYAELPTSRILPDGSLAAPLPDWRTGPDEELSTPPKRRRRKTDITIDSDNVLAEPPKVKRSRRSKVAACEVEGSEASTCETKARRARKKTPPEDGEQRGEPVTPCIVLI